MKKALEQEQKIADICSRYGARFLALFGSKAQGEKTARDTDIAVSFGRPITAREELDFFYEMVRLFETDKIDVVIVDRANPVLLKEVALHGIPLYERDKSTFDEFIISAISKYQDTRENRRIAARLTDDYLREQHRRGA